MAGSGFENNLLFAINADFSNSTAPAIANGLVTDNQVWMGDTVGNANGSHALVKTVTAGTGITFNSTATTFTINSTAASTDLHTARFIVSAGGATDGANYTTITSAIAAAQAAGGVQTVFIQPGTYTENLTLPANINLSAYVCDPDTPNVTIEGTITATTVGVRVISAIRLQTNSAAVLSITGTVATEVYLKGCFINATNNTAIISTTTSTGTLIRLDNCRGNLGTTGIAYFSIDRGSINIAYSNLTNTGVSAAQSTSANNSNFNISYSTFDNAVSYSGSSTSSIVHSTIKLGGIAVIPVTTSSTGTTVIRFSRIESDTQSSATIGAGSFVQCQDTIFDSSNTNVLTGAGTLTYGNLTFTGTSSGINTTTTAGYYSDLGQSLARKQPYFLAYLNTSVTNVTGDGTVYTIIFDTEVEDTGGDFNLGTSTFTAPKTAHYHFDLGVLLGGGTSITAASTRIVVAGTSAATYDRGCGVSSGTTSVSGMSSITIPMTSGDTATFQIQSTDSGGKVDDVNGVSGALRRTYVSGYLAF